MLPEVALLEIFNFYVDEAWIEAWYTLVHVCQRWRNVVFKSPRRLNLRLYCGASTPVRKTLDVWPPLPIVVKVYTAETWGVDNIIATLEHNDRICDVILYDVPSPQLEKVLAAMQQPFPTLTFLQLWSGDETTLVIPSSILGGFAPSLQTLILNRIPFPGLRKLLLSATQLVHLYLGRIPHSGYISPEAMATCLAVLTRLESLTIGFECPQFLPDRKSRRPPTQTRSLLPILTNLQFSGVAEYLEDVVIRIDAPLLDRLHITFFHQLIFDTPHLIQFISRAPKFKALDEACVLFSHKDVRVKLPLPQTFDGVLRLGISCRQSDWQLSSLAQVCSSSFPQALIPTVERLYIQSGSWRMQWQDGIENSQWLEFFLPFSGVKDLYISREFAPHIAPALQVLVGERVMEVLPALQTLFLEETHPLDPAQETIEQFVAARRISSHPIGVSHWESRKDEWYEFDS